MDIRTRKTYPSKEDAFADGVEERFLKNIEVRTILKGIFKGRSYEVKEDGSLGKRVYPTDMVKPIDSQSPE